MNICCFKINVVILNIIQTGLNHSRNSEGDVGVFFGFMPFTGFV